MKLGKKELKKYKFPVTPGGNVSIFHTTDKEEPKEDSGATWPAPLYRRKGKCLVIVPHFPGVLPKAECWNVPVCSYEDPSALRLSQRQDTDGSFNRILSTLRLPGSGGIQPRTRFHSGCTFIACFRSKLRSWLQETFSRVL